MVDEATLREIALSFPDTDEKPHFAKTSFRVNKKIFATYSTYDRRACLKLSEVEQSVFCLINKAIIYPVPTNPGRQGWTLFELDHIEKDILLDALELAYYDVSAKK